MTTGHRADSSQNNSTHSDIELQGSGLAARIRDGECFGVVGIVGCKDFLFIALIDSGGDKTAGADSPRWCNTLIVT